MAIELEDGTIVRSLPEQVDYLTTHNEENEIAIDNLAARLEAAIAGVLHYKGSVATYADLPADAEVGDVYNVIDTGANYAWTGSEWDELGSSINVSSLVDLTSAQTISGIKTFSTKIQFGDSNNSIGVNSNELELKSGSQIRVYNNIRPSSGDSYSLGSRTLPFKEIHLSHAINPNASGYGLTLPDTSGFTADSELLDSASDQTISGKKIFTKDKSIYFGDANSPTRIYQDGASIKFASRLQVGQIFPTINKLQDIGNGLGWYYRDLWLYRNIVWEDENGNQQTIAIKDIFNLIAYAKGQGWIS